MRSLAGGDTRNYALRLERGHFAEVRVLQHSRDVEIALLAPDGRVLAVRNAMEKAYAPFESVCWVATVAGVYRIRVHALGDSSVAGPHEVVWSESHRAEGVDHARSRADSLFAAASARYARTAVASMRAADTLFQRVALVYDSLGLPAWSLRARRSAGDALLAAGNYAASEVLYRATLSTAERLADTSAIALGKMKLGTNLSQANRKPEALRADEEGLALLRATGDSALRAILLINLGHEYTGRQDSTATSLRYQALAIGRALGDARSVSAALNNLAHTLQSQSRWEEALEANAEALALSRRLRDKSEEATSLNNRGAILNELGRSREAQEMQELALNVIREAGGDHQTEASILSNLASHRRRDNPKEAVRLFMLSLAAADSAADSTAMATTAYNLGNLYNGLDSLAKSRAYLQRALSVHEAQRNTYALQFVYGIMGRVEFKSGDTESAFASLARSLAASAQLNDLRTRAITLLTLATYRRESGQFDAAQTAVDESIRLWEKLRLGVAASGLRTSLTARLSGSYEFAVDLAMRAAQRDGSVAHLRDAFDYAERSRAKSLVESLSPTRLRLLQTADPALRTREADIEAAIGDALKRRGDAAERSLRVDSLTRELDRTRAMLFRDKSGLAALTDVPPLTTRQVQEQLLDSSSVLLEYMVGSDRSFLFVIRRDTLAAFPLPKEGVLDTLVRGFYSDLGARTRKPDGENVGQWRRRLADADTRVDARARQLSNVLLRPALPLIAGKRLLVVPFGALHHVPFAALPEPRGSSGFGSPVLDGHEVVVLPSATVAALLRQRGSQRARAQRTLAVIGDPVFSAGERRSRVALGGLDLDSLSRSAADQEVLRGAVASGLVGETLARLSAARREIVTVAGMVPASDRTVATDYDATLEWALSPAFGRHRIVHIASHALLNSNNPDLSAIALSFYDRAGKPIDGFLRLHHLYGMQLNAELVVLSACETALGETFGAEGATSLARGFLQAGASRVVASLWKVDDEATTELMKRFYRHLLGRPALRPAAALRAAQLELRRDPRWSQPFFWAGFVLQGDWN